MIDRKIVFQCVRIPQGMAIAGGNGYNGLTVLIHRTICDFVCLFLYDCCIFFLYFEYDLYNEINK